jgi:hypothetical protein
MDFACGIDSGSLPGESRILEDLLRSDGGGAVESGASDSTVASGISGGMKEGVTADSADQSCLLRELFEDGPVGVAAVDTDPQRAIGLSLS